jgi:hypothetical protein
MPRAKRSLKFAVVEGAPAFEVVEDPACVVAETLDVVVVDETPVVVVADELHPEMTTTKVNTRAEKVSTASNLDRARLTCDRATASSPRLWLRSLRERIVRGRSAHLAPR